MYESKVNNVARLLLVPALIVSTMIVGMAPYAFAGETPGVGGQAPEFALRDLDGKTVKLSELREQGPVVVVVLRGYPGYQCPLCSRQVGELTRNAKPLAEAGLQIVLVYPGPATDLQARAAEFIGTVELPSHFTLVTDPDYTFVNAYGLRWNAPRETAYPSAFVVGMDGKVRFANVSKTHGGRTNASTLLKAAKS